MKTMRTGTDFVAAGLARDAAAIDRVGERYAVAMTPALAALVDRDDPDDPIARQFVPRVEELDTRPEERADPVGDHPHSPVKGIVHRYPDRALLKITLVCPVYCRFCFRREMVGPGDELTPAELAAALDYIRAHPAIFEVILTGGDPLVLSARRLREVIDALQAIEHVKVIRVHSRVPIADPARIDDDLVAALATDKAIFVAVHVNHPRELSVPARAALARLNAAGIPLLGQSVLLKGVNDDAATLEALFRAMVGCRVKPYYLHHADLAPGTAHFRATIAEGRALMRQLRGRVSGIALPTYILDVPGGFGKVPVGPDYLDAAASVVTDPAGARHRYP